MSERIDREWISEFSDSAGSLQGGDHEPLLREFVIQERAGNYFDIYQTHPERKLLTRLTLDEALGYAALAIANGRGDRLRTVAQERASWSCMVPGRKLEPWGKQLAENCPR